MNETKLWLSLGPCVSLGASGSPGILGGVNVSKSREGAANNSLSSVFNLCNAFLSTVQPQSKMHGAVANYQLDLGAHVEHCCKLGLVL